MTVWPVDARRENRKKMESANVPIQNRPESMSAPKSPEHLTGLNGKSAVLGVCVLLVIAVLLVFGRTMQHEFVNFDDQQYFYANPQVQHGLTWSGVAWAFQSTYAANWHPLTWLSLMLDVELFGPGPAGPHLTNVILHAASTVLLFLLLRRMTGAHWRSALVAGLFGLHPLHVESVAWVSERKDVLSGLFFMLTLLMYVQYVQGVTGGKWQVPGTEAATAAPDTSRVTRHTSFFYGLALLFFTLGLMSKPMLVTVPFVLLLLDYWPLQRFEPSTLSAQHSTIRHLIWEKLPFLALAAMSCVVTYLVQCRGETMVPLANLPPVFRMANGLLAYVSYLGKAFWPVELAVFYPLPTKLSVVAVIGAGVVLLGTTAAVIWRARREPWLATGWFWYLGMLVPVIGLVQVGGQSIADRYTYIPYIGLFMMLCWSVPHWVIQQRIFKMVACVTAGVVLAACAWRSGIQVGYWKNSETLFRHALEVTQDNGLAHCSLGIALGQAGRYEEAIEQYEQVLRIKPDNFDAHHNLAGTLARLGRVAEAIGHWEQALQIKPDCAEAHYDLGIALEQAGKPDNAIGHYEQALWFKPDYAEAHYQLGLLLAARGRAAEAGEHFSKALEIKPDFAEAHNTLGTVLAQQGQVAEAIGHFQKAIEVKPRFAEAHNNLGNALANQGRYAEAIEHYQQALETKPDYAEAHYNLGNALALQGKYAEAIGHFQKALQLRPDDMKARRSLDAAQGLLNQVHGRNWKTTRSVNMLENGQLKNQAVDPPSDRPAVSDSKGAVIGMCVLLGVAVLLVFCRTLRYDFVNYDDDQYFYANPQVQHGLTGSSVAWAFQSTYAANWHPLTWLSLMLDVETVWARASGAASDQSAVTRGQYRVVVSIVQTNDGLVLAERLGGGVVWAASVARRVGGLGVGAQGCVECVLFPAHIADVCAVCPKTVESRRARGESTSNSSPRHSTLDPRLLFDVIIFRAGADEQADAGDATVRTVVAGLLAAPALWGFNPPALGFGETAISCIECGFCCNHSGGAAGSSSTSGTHLPRDSSGKRDRLLCALFVQGILAGNPRDSLSPLRILAFLGVLSVRGIDSSRERGGGAAWAQISVSGHRLVLVLGNADPHDWTGAGGNAIHGGSLHLPAAHRRVHHAGIWNGCSV